MKIIVFAIAISLLAAGTPAWAGPGQASGGYKASGDKRERNADRGDAQDTGGVARGLERVLERENREDEGGGKRARDTSDDDGDDHSDDAGRSRGRGHSEDD